MQQDLILSIGSNLHAAENMTRAQQLLMTLLPGIRFTSRLQTEAIGREAPPYINCLAMTQTNKRYEELNQELKHLENQLGRDRTNRQGLVSIDVDILLLGSVRYHTRDWTRDYVTLLIDELKALR